MYLLKLTFLFSLKFLDCMIVLVLISWGIPLLFSIITAPIYIPINSAQLFVFPTSCQHLLFLVFFIIAILTGMNWYLFLILISISLISNNEHLFMCLLIIFMSPLEKCLFRSSTHFLIGLAIFFAIDFYEYLYILDINLFLNMWFANIFS